MRPYAKNFRVQNNPLTEEMRLKCSNTKIMSVIVEMQRGNSSKSLTDMDWSENERIMLPLVWKSTELKLAALFGHQWKEHTTVGNMLFHHEFDMKIDKCQVSIPASARCWLALA